MFIIVFLLQGGNNSNSNLWYAFLPAFIKLNNVLHLIQSNISEQM